MHSITSIRSWESACAVEQRVRPCLEKVCVQRSNGWQTVVTDPHENISDINLTEHRGLIHNAVHMRNDMSIQWKELSHLCIYTKILWEQRRHLTCLKIMKTETEQPWQYVFKHTHSCHASFSTSLRQPCTVWHGDGVCDSVCVCVWASFFAAALFSGFSSDKTDGSSQTWSLSRFNACGSVLSFSPSLLYRPALRRLSLSLSLLVTRP